MKVAFRRLVLFGLPILMVLGVAIAQNSTSKSKSADQQSKKSLKIVPIVSLKPGETKKLLLSTHCTVGPTRGGGFSIMEMREGAAVEGQTKGHEEDGASYSRDGVTIRAPGEKQALQFAASPAFASLKKAGIAAFEITISASNQAKPELLEFHLVDATCSGHCTTDFRVLVLSQ